MATSSDPIVGMVTQGDSPLLSRRVTANVGGVDTVVTQAMLDPVDGVTFRVFDHQAGEVTTVPVVLDVPSVIDDTPPSTGLLSGMNFSFQLNDYMLRGNRRYRVQVTFKLTGGQTATRTWVLWTENLAGM